VADGLQQQKKMTDSNPSGQEQKSKAVVGTNSAKPDNSGRKQNLAETPALLLSFHSIPGSAVFCQSGTNKSFWVVCF